MLVTTLPDSMTVPATGNLLQVVRHEGCYDVAGKDVAVAGRFPRLAKLHAEFHDHITDPVPFLASLKQAGVGADVFTFLQPVSDTTPRHGYLMRPEPIAVLHIDTYEKWWKEQVNDKTRNMVRKPGKKGVEIREVEFTDELARGIHVIYNESPIIQGRKSKHFGKDFETLKRAHMTFLDRSIFIGAFFEGQLIGFIKMIIQPGGQSVSLMQIISLVKHRDKSPTNGLLAKAIEICATRGVCCLQYGVWSRRSLGDFKKHHGFVREELPRYFVPLNARGKMALALNLHRKLSEFVPGTWQDALVNWRTRWNYFRHPTPTKD